MKDLQLAVVGAFDGGDRSEESPSWWCKARKVPRSVPTLAVIEDPIGDDPDAECGVVLDVDWHVVYRYSGSIAGLETYVGLALLLVDQCWDLPMHQAQLS